MSWRGSTPCRSVRNSFSCLLYTSQPAEAGERREWLTSFTAVEVSAPLDVRFVQVPDTEAPKIVYDTKGSYTTKFRAEVRDKVLRITERSDARRPERTSVTVSYTHLGWPITSRTYL